MAGNWRLKEVKTARWRVRRCPFWKLVVFNSLVVWRGLKMTQCFFFRVLTRTFPGSKILGRKTSTRSVRTFNIWKRLLFLRMNFCVLKYYKDCKSACCHTFQTQKQEYVYILSLTNKKHVPVIMCFRFPNVRKTWE